MEKSDKNAERIKRLEKKFEVKLKINETVDTDNQIQINSEEEFEDFIQKIKFSEAKFVKYTPPLDK